MQTLTFIKGTMIAASFTLMMMAASMANASENVSIPTLKNTVKRGAIISESMLTSINHPANRITSTMIEDTFDVIGMEATRTVRAGLPLRYKQFRVSPTVKKGNTATVTFQKSGITLTTEGTVMSDAIAGDFVKIMNLHSKRLLNGIVQENGTISVN